MPTNGHKPGADPALLGDLAALAGGGPVDQIMPLPEGPDETPVDYMLRLMRDRTIDWKRRDAMAKAVAVYLHPRPLAAKPRDGEITLQEDADARRSIDEKIAIFKAERSRAAGVDLGARN